MENIKSYLDGELDIAQQAEVETHLRNDADLQQLVEEFRSISSTFKTVDTGEPYGKEQLLGRLSVAADSRRNETKKIWRIAGVFSGVAACLVTAVVFFPVFAQSKDSAATFAMTDKAQVATSAPASSGDVTVGSASAKAPVASMAPPATKAAPGEPETPAAATDSFDKDRALNESGGGFAGKKMAPPEQMDMAKAAPESKFKSDMRALRDRNVQGSNTLNDTPHGIYLERTGQIQVKVDDLMRSVDEATGMVQSLDGYVVSHDLQNTEDGGSATMVAKVPTKNYNAAMNKLQAMGEVISVNSSSNDITTETVDNSARMISWADEEKRLSEELAKAKDENHKWRIRQQLSVVRANLASEREVVKSLKDRAEYSTINISFLRGDKAAKAGGTANWSGNAYRDAKSGLGSVGQVFGVICIYLAVFSPVWLPLAIAGLIIRKRNQG